MTTHSPTPHEVRPAETATVPPVQVDLVLGGRAVATAQHLAGLIAAAELDTAGRPERLARDLFPDVDPEIVQMIWERSAAVHYRAGLLAGSPRFHRDVLVRLQGELEEAGFVAMGGMVQRAVSTAVSAHPADDGREGREHDDV